MAPKHAKEGGVAMTSTNTPAATPSRWLFIFAGLALLPIVAMGYWASFTNLVELAEQTGWEHPVTLPIILDAGIPAFLLMDYAYTIGGRQMPMLRWAAWGATVFTVWANWSVDDSLLRALPPVVPIVAAETFRIYRLYRKGLTDNTVMDRVRFGRWIVSPIRTTKLKVRMVRSELTSYRSAIALEDAVRHARAVARTELRDRGFTGRRLLRYLPEDVRKQLKDWRLPAKARVAVERGVHDDGVDWEAAVGGWMRTTIQTTYPDQADPQTRTGGEQKPDHNPDHNPDHDPDRTRTTKRTITRTMPGPTDGPRDVEALFPAAVEMDRVYFAENGKHMSAETMRKAMRCNKDVANELIWKVRRNGDLALTGSDR